MTKVEKLTKMIADQEAARAARKQAQPPPGPAEPRKPKPEDGRDMLDRASGREYLSISRIVPDPLQPRRTIDPEEIRQLAGSFKLHGQLQPIVVSWNEELGKWQIVVGEKRWMAAQMAGLDRIWCSFAQKAIPLDERREKQLVENCLRSDPPPMEFAQAIFDLMEMKGYTQQQVADRLQLSQASIARALALLGLPKPIQDDVVAGKISPDIATEIGKLDDPADQQEVAEKIVNEGMNRAEARKEVKAKRQGKATNKPTKTRTYRRKACTITLAFKRPPTDVDIIVELRAQADELEQQQRAAA